MAFSIWIAGTICVTAAGRSRTGSRVAILLPTLLLPLPAFVRAPPVVKGLLAFAIVTLLATALDFGFGPRPSRAIGRLAYALAFPLFVDAGHVAKQPRRYDRVAALRFFAALVAASVALLVWGPAQFLEPVLCYLARSICGAVIVVAAAEAITSVVSLLSAAAGVLLRPVHDAPYLARTLGEFWSRRWNLLAGSWLRRHIFLPLSRHAPRLALFATFVASAALHAYLIVSIDRPAALSWAAFFLLQPVLLLVERYLHVRRWPIPLARAWTMTTLVLLIPLLLGPILPLFHTSLCG